MAICFFVTGYSARRLKSNGETIFDFTGPESSYINVRTFAEGPDGSILLSGYFPPLARKGLVRISASGEFDPSFNPDLSMFFPTWQSYAVAVEPNGKIIASVIGFSERGGFIVRLHATGEIDRTFEPVQFEFPGGVIGALRKAVVQPNGGIVVGGYFESVDETDTQALVRLKGGEENLTHPLLMRSLAVESSADAVITLSVQPFKTFVVERSDDLNNWQTLTTNTSVSARFDFKDTAAKNSNRYFYRTRLLNP